MSTDGAAIAQRAHVHVADVRRGRRVDRLRGGVKRCVAGEPASLDVMAELGSPLHYYGPIAELTEVVPVVVRVAGRWPYRVLEVHGGQWASSSDAARAREGEPVYGVIPFDLRRENSEAWRANPWFPVGEVAL